MVTFPGLGWTEKKKKAKRRKSIGGDFIDWCMKAGENWADLGFKSAEAYNRWFIKESGRSGVPKEMQAKVFKRDDCVCRLTHKHINTRWRNSDHIKPLKPAPGVQGGGTTLGNLQVLCGRHNRQKSNKDWDGFKKKWRKSPTSCDQ